MLRGLGLTLGMALLFGSRAQGLGVSELNPTQGENRQFSQLPETPQDNPENEPGETPTADEARFSCQLINGQYTVMYHPQSQPGQAYAWATPTELGGGWTPERRCNEITRRLEFYRPDGLVELGTGIENEYDIICVTTQADGRCRIVLTVPPGQDPQQTRDLVFQNIVTADSGQSTDAVNALTGNGDEIELLEDLLGVDLSELERQPTARSGAINLRPFLDSFDGGTGEMLQSGVSTSPKPKLNPENFR